ncbi:MAG: rod shape-determining protein MreD [Gallionella sp.]
MYYLTYTKSSLQRPASPFLMVLTLVLALIFNALPWQGVGLILRPDAVAVVLLYWCLHKPEHIGIGIAWMVGIFSDVAHATVLGQHALAYSIMAFSSMLLHRRLQMFHLYQQIPQAFGMLTLTYVIYALVDWRLNHTMVWWYFLGCITSVLSWLWFSITLQVMQQLREDRDPL